MWDMKTGRSRGYGFVAFRDRMEADRALTGMNGEFLGSRAIRCNWANQKGQPSVAQQQVMTQMGMNPVQQAFPAQPPQQQQQQQQQVYPTPNAPSFAAVLQQTPQHMTTVYVGNLSPYTTQPELLPLFQNYGYVQEVRLQTDRGYAFVKMDSHEGAAQAIVALNNYNINGKPLKLGVSPCGRPALLNIVLTICSGARTRTRLATLSTKHFLLRTLSQVSLNLQAISLSTVNKPCLLRVSILLLYSPEIAVVTRHADVGLPAQYQNANYGQYQHGAYSRTPANQYASYPTPTYGYPQQGTYPANGYQQ